MRSHRQMETGGLGYQPPRGDQRYVFEVHATGVGEQIARSAVLLIPEYMRTQGVTDKDPDIRQETQQRKGI